MSNKKEKIIDQFLESHNMDYLFCILADKESERLSKLPDSIKNEFAEKITTMSLKHIAKNDVPDFIVETYEQEETQRIYNEDDTEDQDDNLQSEQLKHDNLNNYSDDEDDDDYYDEDDDEDDEEDDEDDDNFEDDDNYDDDAE